MGFRFLHLADVHLETSFGGRTATRERLRRATREAFSKAVDYAIEENLHAVLVAGDFYDDPILSLRIELEILRQVRRLDEAGVWFLYACGNHDPGAAHLRAASLGIESERVHVFRTPTPEAITIRDEDGQPVGIVVAAGHSESAEATNLAARFPSLDTPLPVVGLLHTHVASARSGDEHDRYAPSQGTDYRKLDYSYWALGHIHIRQRAVEGLPVFYAGNLQGRNPRETGAKGGLVVEAHAGAWAEPEFVRFGPVRWEHIRADTLPTSDTLAALCDHLADAIGRIEAEPGEVLAVRVDLSGPTPLARALRSAADRASLETELAQRTGAIEVQLCDVGVVLPVDRELLRASPTVVAEALALIERAEADADLLAELAPETLARDGLNEAERQRYLRELLSELPEELIERSLARGAE